ncbi:hypothetical protein D3C74_49890 [compost metagenome]
MSMSLYPVCHTCKTFMNGEGYTRDFCHQVLDDWKEKEHEGHEVVMLVDVLGFDDEYDKMFDTVMEEYKEIRPSD